MLDPIVEFFERLLTQFTWRRLVFVLSLGGLAVGGFWWYESYTASFQLTRIEKAAELLDRLGEVGDAKAISRDAELKEIHSALKRDLAAVVERRTTPFSLTVAPRLSPGLVKVLAALAPWVLLCLVMAMPGVEAGGATYTGVALVAVPSVVVAALLPEFDPIWVNYWGYPIGHFVLIMILINLWARRKKKKGSSS